MTRTVPSALAALVVALLSTGSARGSDRIDVGPGVGEARGDACAAVAVRPPCHAVARETAREVASDGVLTPAPRQAWAAQGFDRDGNALDRRGRILAVPGSAGRPAEVFTAD